MDQVQKAILLKQIMWDYSIPANDIELVLDGKIERAGHYSKQEIIKKLLESYSWFTLLQLFTPGEIKNLLTNDVVKTLRTPSLRKNYEFIRKRLHQVVSITG